MPSVTLLLAIHNHQPDGNFDEVFARGYDDCYQRIVAALEAAPHVRCALHHTGALLEWIESHRPDYFPRLRALCARGQIELLGGGFYEPMLAVLPERDALGQLRAMSDYCVTHFGAAPSGMWLAERVWEPGLPPLIARAGLRYTLIDDGHFRYAGETGPLHGYYATEKAGTAIAIFPIDQKLRYAIPFAEPAAAIKTILELGDTYGAHTPSPVVTYGDDGEKFGMWPGTKEWVWDKGWLTEFFRLLAVEKERITTSTPSDVLAARPPSGRVYLPTASYEEMGEWTLPAHAQERYHEVRHALEERGELEAARPFLRGGIWQGFLAKYDEANFMHKKMVLVSDKVARAVDERPGWKSEIAVMHRELYRAQCNCSYWHGLFGGLYLNYLRDTVYRHLLVAEAFADAILGRPAPAWAPGAVPGPPIVEELDVDADLEREIVVQSAGLDVTIRPHQGGTVQELAYRPKTFMLSNVLGRHEEGYHKKLRAHLARGDADEGDAPKSIHDLVQVKEPHLDRYLVYDTYPRHLFVDHFLSRDETLDAFAAGNARELGDFVAARYFRIEGESLTLERIGTVEGRTVRLRKSYCVGAQGLGVRYELALLGGAQLDIRFAPELSLTLLDGHSVERSYRLPDRDLPPDERVLASRGEWRSVPSLALINDANKFRLDLSFGDDRPSVWRFPLETVSNSEAGFERTYQGSVIVPLFDLHLGAHARFTLDLSLSDL